MDNRTGVYQIWTSPISIDSSTQLIIPPNILTAVTDTFSITLTWNDNSDNELGFIVERKEGPISSGNTFVKIDSTVENATSYFDANLKSNTTYTYRLQAFNNDTVSAYSNFIEATTLQAADSVIYVFNLNQNYPNPFITETRIKFELEIPSNTLLKLFDILGNAVATIVNQELSAGSHEVKFNSNKLASGIYFYQLTAGSFTDTKKMILLR